MSNELSRRQLLQVGGSFVAGAAGTTLLGKLAPVFAQPSKLARKSKNTFYTNGRHLYDSSGKKTILRGINLPLLDDWDFPQSDKLGELEKTGANAVRIQWYKDYGQSGRPAYSIASISSI